MGFENFPPKKTDVQSIEKPKTAGKMDFITMAENLNPEIGKLETEMGQLVQRIGAIEEQMRAGKYAGRLTDLSELVEKRKVLKKQIESHQDFGSKRQGYDINQTGRDASARKWTDRKPN